MNKYNKTSIEKLQRAAKTYQRDVTSALEKYRQTMTQARKDAEVYKDESSFLAGKKGGAVTTARNSIKIAENVFTAEVKAEIGNLKDELHRHLITAPNDNFLSALNVYATYGIKPGKAEISALIESAGGNSLSLRALDAVLQKTGAEYRVKVPGADAFERDIDNLERIAEGHIFWSDEDHHHELVEVFSGVNREIRAEDGSYYDAGYRWDNTALIISSKGFEKSIADIAGMAGRWSDNILPTMYKSEAYPNKTDEKTGAQITGAEQFVEDYTATASAAEVIPAEDNGHAAKLGRVTGEQATRTREIMNAYIQGGA